MEDRISTMRLYGASIAIVSGGYSLYLVSTAPSMTMNEWGMAVLGLIVLLHGVVLLTSLYRRLGPVSGPLMVGYAVLMLGNQWWMEMTNQPNGMMGQPMAVEMGVDPGMVAIAILMLLSGLIMTVRRDMMTSA